MPHLIYGVHTVSACVLRHPQQIAQVYVMQNSGVNMRIESVLNLVRQHNNITITSLPKTEFIRLSKGHNHQGIVAELIDGEAISLRHYHELQPVLSNISNKDNAVILILDGVTDNHNLGAIIRTAECFGVDALILPKNNSANPENPAVAKTSSGAVYRLPIITVNNLSRAIEQLKEEGFWVAGTTLAPESISLFDFKFSGKLAWILGSEDVGIRRLIQENCDYLVHIPMQGETQSLNVSVAAGVALAYTRFALVPNLGVKN